MPFLYRGFEILTDALLVLRHSIHKISSRNPESGSKYDYKMYALVHRTQSTACIDPITKLGFEVIVVDPQFQIEDLQDEFVRMKMPLTDAFGHHEYIKLYAYHLTEDMSTWISLSTNLWIIFSMRFYMTRTLQLDDQQEIS
jgi:hypothetical protein